MDGGLALGLDLVATLALALAYLALAVPRASGDGALRALSVPLAAAVAVAGVAAAAGLLDRGAIDPKTALPTTLATVGWATVVGRPRPGSRPWCWRACARSCSTGGARRRSGLGPRSWSWASAPRSRSPGAR